MITMKIGYARVSTYRQKKYGESLQNQIEKLKKAGCEKVFSEQFTGTKKNRPQFQKCLKFLRSGDTLEVWKMDRLGRNMNDITSVVYNLIDKGITVFIVANNLKVDNKTIMGKMALGMLSMFSDLEHSMIINRMENGKRYALKTKGKEALGGRPKRLESKKMKHYLAIYKIYKERKQLKQKDPKYYAKLYDKPVYQETAELGGCSVQTVYNIINTCKSLSKNQIEKLGKK